MNLNKLKYLRNDDVTGGAKCTARIARPRTPLPYTTPVVQLVRAFHWNHRDAGSIPAIRPIVALFATAPGYV